MKRFPLHKGLMLFTLGCIFSWQGGVFASGVSENLLQNEGGQPAVVMQDQQEASPVIAGETGRVSITREGTVRVVSGKSLILKPGTRISSGSFQYAAVEPAVHSGKPAKKVVKVVTIEEKRKIDEQASLSVAYTLFKPFPASGKGTLRKGDGDHGNIDLSGNELTAITPEQQRKVSSDIFHSAPFSRPQAWLSCAAPALPSGYRPETTRVLRL